MIEQSKHIITELKVTELVLNSSKILNMVRYLKKKKLKEY